MKAKELDKQFDKGEDITKHLDLSKAFRPKQDKKSVRGRKTKKSILNLK